MSRYLITIITLLLFARCANELAPSGGPKDTTPPKILNIDPPNRSTNMSSDDIVIEFDEYIVLKDPMKQIFISPPLTEQPEYKISGKKLKIELPDSLDPKITYLINFGESIKDNNEGNILEQFSYVFSKGPTLDSLTISGSVLNVPELTQAKNTIILLYKDGKDSSFIKNKPTYVSRSDDNGNFSFYHLAPGNYDIYALTDENLNYIYDDPKEKIAFLVKPILIPDSTLDLRLHLFQEKQEKPQITSTSLRKPGVLTLILNKEIKSIVTNMISDSTNNIAIHSTIIKEDTAHIFIKGPGQNGKKLAIQINETLRDTITLNPSGGGKDAFKNESLLSFKKFPSTNQTKHPYHTPVNLNSNAPIYGIDIQRFTLLSDTNEIERSKYNILVSDDSMTIQIDHQFNFENKYTITVHDSFMMDMYNRYNDSSTWKVEFRPASFYGVVNLKAQMMQVQRIIQMINVSGKLVKENLVPKNSNEIIHIKDLPPGFYTIRVIYDENNNGKWDPGILSQKKLPEEVAVYNDPVEVKANWEVDVSLINLRIGKE